MITNADPLHTAVVPIGADRKTFAQCFNRLAKAKRAKDIDTADLEIYYGVLGRYPLWAIEEAALELMKKPTYGFPTTDVWVQEVQAEIARRDRQNLTKQRAWKDECPTCGDSGWKEYVCTQEARCGRQMCAESSDKHTHTYYVACPCREHNGTYRRRTLASQLGHVTGKSKDKG